MNVFASVVQKQVRGTYSGYMGCAQTHESERDVLILLSLSLSWFCAKTQRIPDTWDGTLRSICSGHGLAVYTGYDRQRSQRRKRAIFIG